MKFERRRRSRAPAVSIVSMADIAFLLIIFFMVTTSFTRDPQLEVQLPSAKTGEVPARPAQVTITVRRDGSFSIDERPADRGALTEQLRARVLAAREPVVVIAADEGVAWEEVVYAMDCARSLGVSALELSVREPDQR